MDKVAAGGFGGGQVLSTEEVVSKKADEEIRGLLFRLYRFIVAVDTQGTLFVDICVSGDVSNCYTGLKKRLTSW